MLIGGRTTDHRCGDKSDLGSALAPQCEVLHHAIALSPSTCVSTAKQDLDLDALLAGTPLPLIGNDTPVVLS